MMGQRNKRPLLLTQSAVMAVLDTAILFDARRGRGEKDARVEPAHDGVNGKGRQQGSSLSMHRPV